MKAAHTAYPSVQRDQIANHAREHLAGVRAVALVELFKGMLVLAGGIGLFTLLHKDIGDVAENIIEHLHLNPAHRIEQVFIRAASNMSDRRIVALACAAFAYTVIRFVEAYGLWHCRAWAEWFAIISGSLYLPWEILEIVKHNNHIRWAVLIVNVIVVLYMIYVRWDAIRHRGLDDRIMDASPESG